MSTSSQGPNQSSLARFAFNIYGSFNERSAPKGPEMPKSRPGKLKYVCDREITCVSQLQHAVGRTYGPSYEPASSTSHHVLIGGKNYLRMLSLSASQDEIVGDTNLLEAHAPPSRAHASSRLFNVNTIKSKADLVACGLTNGHVDVFHVSGSGATRLAHRLDGHKRVVNSVDFADHENVMLSGSQDGTIRLWDLRSYSPRPVAKLMASQHADPVRSCQYSPHARIRGKMAVLSVHDSGALCKYDLRYPSSAHTGVAFPERRWTFHTGPALSLHIHPELEHVLTCGRDRKICLWNYADAHSSAPEAVINTYGPVMKVRWNETPNASMNVSEHENLPGNRALYAYDFACSYLNDDPSISVFNLARRHVPREIVSTLTRKPFQNFVWAKGAPGARKLWTITKSNVFVSYDLDSPYESAQNIARPCETLPAVSTAWRSGSMSLSVVSQDTHDYDMSMTVADSVPDLPERAVSEDGRAEFESYHDPVPHASPASFDTAFPLPNRAPPSHPATPTYFYQKNPVFSPNERPMLLRSSTQQSQHAMSSSLGFSRPHIDFAMSQPSSRPSLRRNPSQNTVESASSGGTVFQPVLAHSPHHTYKNVPSPSQSPSPYVVSMSLPLPLADDAVFAALATEYLTAVPDAFTLAFVCSVNARVAASVSRFRDCQTWKMIGVALEQDVCDNTGLLATQQGADLAEHENDNASGDASLDVLSRSPGDAKSISSDLGNVVGSYNSDSTSATNYGGAPRKRSNTSSMNNLSILGSSRESARGEHLLRSRTSSHQSMAEAISGDNLSRSNSFGKRSFASSSRAMSGLDQETRLGISKTEKDDSVKDTKKKEEPSDLGLEGTVSPVKPIGTSKLVHESTDRKTRRSTFSVSGRHIRGEESSNPPLGASHDLDNENLHAMTNISASYASSGLFNSEAAHSNQSQAFSPGSRDSQACSWQSLTGKSLSKFKPPVALFDNKVSLDRVEESSIKSKEIKPSQLTMAMTGRAMVDDIFRPWSAVSIIEKSLEYALAQGDLVMSATLILLFYEYFLKQSETLLGTSESLEVLGLYVETLRSKEMYTTAVQVVKDAPVDLKERLSDYAVKEVEMRFYCGWCKTLLTNEISKAKYGVDSDQFGFWYCDECSRKQSNCVYCHEPCKGLTVVESLKCGHRGHFGCFQEWHIEDGNTECPGGCE
ncbi:hypothetical protein OXX80_005198 [Metschnikowia pulcherrima]